MDLTWARPWSSVQHMDEFFEVVTGAVLALAVFFGIMFGVANLSESVNHDECHSKGDLLRIQVTYRKWDGCYVKQNNLWMPFDTWKYNRDNGIVK
jgi:hypothetical protein